MVNLKALAELSIKPCPFCGQPGQIDTFVKYNNWGKATKCVMVNCTTPGGCCAGSIEIPYLKATLEESTSEAIEAWNRRA